MVPMGFKKIEMLEPNSSCKIKYLRYIIKGKLKIASCWSSVPHLKSLEYWRQSDFEKTAYKMKGTRDSTQLGLLQVVIHSILDKCQVSENNKHSD